MVTDICLFIYGCATNGSLDMFDKAFQMMYVK